MKNFILSSVALLVLLATPLARAWSYNNGDLLLVFRNGSYDIEYDLGSVTNLLGHANGYTTTITGWNSSLVTGLFGTDLTGVDVILLAVTSPTNASPTAWLSGSEPNTTAYEVSPITWSSDLYNIISAVGNRPLIPFAVPPAAVTPTNAYSIQVAGIDGGASYDDIVTGGNPVGTLSGIQNLGGNASFTVQQTIPGSFDFWAIQPSTIYPNPPPDTLVGTFNITTNGVLTFVAGPRASSITGVSHAGNVSAIQFTTTVGNHYSVAYTNKLNSSSASWPVDANTLIGDGAIDTINHTNNNQSVEFYRVNTQ
jgi:hypothetical protein